MYNEFIIIVIIFLILISLQLFKKNNINKRNVEMINVKSFFDGEYYEVLNKNDSLKTALLLSKIKNNFITLINHLNDNIDKHGSKKYAIKNLKKRIKNLKIIERPSDSDEFVTSYTLNKGELMVICLRKKLLETIHDFNIIFYVCIHELAHIASNSIGHNDEFKSNFKFLLKEAIKLKLYTPVDYRKYPINYCGMVVDEYILD